MMLFPLRLLNKCTDQSAEFFYDLYYEQTFINKFFLTRIEGPRTKDVVNCTDCKVQ